MHSNAKEPAGLNLDRMQTRSRNTEVHPGIAAKAALRVHRPKETIDKEKSEKLKQQKEKQKQKDAEEARKVAGEELLAQFEAEHSTAEKEKQHPRQRSQGKGT